MHTGWIGHGNVETYELRHMPVVHLAMTLDGNVHVIKGNMSARHYGNMYERGTSVSVTQCVLYAITPFSVQT